MTSRRPVQLPALPRFDGAIYGRLVRRLAGQVAGQVGHAIDHRDDVLGIAIDAARGPLDLGIPDGWPGSAASKRWARRRREGVRNAMTRWGQNFLGAEVARNDIAQVQS